MRENHQVVLLRQGRALVYWFLVALATAAPGSAQTKSHATIPWVRNLPSNHAVIIFVHGVTGDELSTWTSSDQYWPSMLTRDPTFSDQNIYVYHYPSPRLRKTFSIDEIAENMRLVLSTDGVLRHNALTFVSHSMGGIVTRVHPQISRYRRSQNPPAVFLCNADDRHSLRAPSRHLQPQSTV